MRTLLFLLCLWGVSLTLPAQDNKKAVFVIVDGISADVIEKLPTPSLDAIAGKNGYTRAHVGGEKGGYSETPTISAVGYNSLLTGVWVHKHDVWDNSIDTYPPNYNYWTIFRLFKQQYPQKKTAVFSSWILNRTILVGEGLQQTGGLQLDYHFDGLELDTVSYPHDKESNYMHRIDEAVADRASEYIRSEAPDLSWVYLQYTDDMGHMFGDSEQFYRSVELMDKQMGRLWEAIEYRRKQFGEDWVIYITTDHGRDRETGKNHGGQSDRERSTWIVTNAKDLNNYFKTGNPGVVDIMPTLARFLHIDIPRERAMEIDGIPLTGSLSAIRPSAVWQDGSIKVNWKALTKKGTVKIWVSPTNRFRSGGTDVYSLAATVPVSQQEVVLSVEDKPSSFYKVVIETPDHFMNRWVIIPSLVTQGPLWGAVWQQRASEYRALCLQAYNLARLQLDHTLRESGTSAKPPAIVTDIDETILDNSPYQVHLALNQLEYADSSWIEWTKRVDCDTIPGALSFLQYAKSRGVDIFYITNRLEEEREQTLKDIQRWGFPDASSGRLLMKTDISGKEPRREVVARSHEIVMLIGDNLSDFSAAFDKQPVNRRHQATRDHAAQFGSRFIVLPNAMYGDWESALYNYRHTLPPSVKDRIILRPVKKY